MKFNFPLKEHKSENLIRRCGYGRIFDRKTNQISYVKKLGRGDYPRFHIYLDDFENFFTVNLHLDQKKASYEGQTSHSGEYDGDIVTQEARRITAIIAQIYGVN